MENVLSIKDFQLNELIIKDTLREFSIGIRLHKIFEYARSGLIEADSVREFVEWCYK